MGFAGTVGEHRLDRFGQRQAFLRLAQPPRREARQLLGDHAGLASRFDLVAQRTQAGAVDLAGGGEGVDALERRRQRARDFRSDGADQVAPTVGVAGIAGSGWVRCGAAVEIRHIHDSSLLSPPKRQGRPDQ
jgi:hypothetical protein